MMQQIRIRFTSSKNVQDDVTIANHMESGGIPGLVHISHETCSNLTTDNYEIEEGNGGQRSVFLRDRNIKTYLIRPKLDANKLSAFGHLRSLSIIDHVSCSRIDNNAS